MAKIYWFKRKKDEQNICIEGEKEASNLLKRRDFKYEWEYLGWSTGETYKKIIAQKGKLTTKEHVKVWETGTLGKVRTDLAKLAYDEELKIALANPDKTIPRSHDLTDLNGKIINDNLMANAIKMMGR